MFTVIYLVSLVIGLSNGYLRNDLLDTVPKITFCKSFEGETPRSKDFSVSAQLLRGQFPNTQMLNFSIGNYNLRCDESETTLHSLMISDNYSRELTGVQRLHFRSADGASLAIPSHFSRDGTFFDGKFYYHPDGEYCIKSYNKTWLNLLLCPINPTTDVLLPKCCPLDQVIYRKLTCRPLSNEQPRWKPNLYLENHKQYFNDIKSKTTQLKVYNENLPSKCQQVEPEPFPFFLWWSPTGLGSENKHRVKMVVTGGPNKTVVPHIYQAKGRKWELKTNINFCVDGTYIPKGTYPNFTAYYGGEPENFVILFCATDEPDIFAQQPWKSWVYAVTSAVSLFFLFVTFTIYLMLLKQHNFHGLTVLMYSFAMFMRYFFICVNYFIILFPDNEFIGLYEKGVPCKVIAVGLHYFYFAGYMWMTVMNVNFVLTFKNLKVSHQKDRRLKSLLIYCLIAWGLPFLLVGLFVYVDHVYQDPYTEVPVPGYGDHICFVTRPFRGHYVYAPVGIIIIANYPLIGEALRVLWKARLTRKKNLKRDGSHVFGKKSGYSAAFFLKLFVIMGGTDGLSMLTWYYHDPDKNEIKPVWLVVIEGMKLLLPIFLFGLLCCNNRLKAQIKTFFVKSAKNGK